MMRPFRRHRRRAVLGISLTVAAAILTLGSIPPPTIPPNGSPSPFPTTLFTPHTLSVAPDVAAPEAVLEDLQSGQVLLAKDASDPRPIASLVKIMTAQVVLSSARPSDIVTVDAGVTHRGGAELGLHAGERIPVEELTYAIMLQSSNDAAVALADHVAGTVPAFAARMNRAAARLGLRQTRFTEPTGLDDLGHSTPLDLATMTRAAFRLPLFAAIVATKFREIPSPSGPDRHIQNRNVLLWLYPGAVGVKTGFTTLAGHCLVAVARRGSRALVAVVMGDREDQAVFDDAAALLNYGFAGFARRLVVRAGEPLGSVPVDGRDVPVVSAKDLTALVPTHPPATVGRTTRLLPGIGLPVTAGQAIGQTTVSVAGRIVGVVDAVASITVPAHSPPPAGGRPGPSGPPSVEGMLTLLRGLLRALVDPFL